jgi:hypothetical protein
MEKMPQTLRVARAPPMGTCPEGQRPPGHAAMPATDKA